MLGKKKDKEEIAVEVTTENTTQKDPKKKFYKQKWFWIVIAALLVFSLFGGNGNDNDKASTEDKSATVEEQADSTNEEATEETAEESTEAEKEKTPLEIATEQGQWWFTHIDWDNVFKYKSKVHYIAGYYCKETPEEFAEYGKYVGISSADLQNGFGAEFTSNVYIFMDENGVAQHVFYDDADGNSTEIPMDSIPMLGY